MVFSLCKRILKDQAVNIYILESKQRCLMIIVNVTECLLCAKNWTMWFVFIMSKKRF